MAGKRSTYEKMRNLLESVAYRPPFFARRSLACPVCGGGGRFFRAIGPRTLYECPQCTHAYLACIPRRAILKLIYTGMQYWHLDRRHQGIQEIQPSEQWAGYLGDRIGVLERTGVLPPSRSLDIFEIGCSEGMLLKALGDRGHRAQGCEANRQVANAGRRRLGARIFPAMFERLDLAPRSFDLVVSYHTLEHVASPASVLAKAAALLRPDGGICIEVPIGPEEFANIDHLHFFTPRSLQCLLRRYFAEAELVDNSYRNAQGTQIGSVYGVGRRPLA